MSDMTIEQLQIEVNSSAEKANTGIDALTSSLERLKTAVGGGTSGLEGINTTINQIGNNATRATATVEKSIAKSASSSKSHIGGLLSGVSKLAIGIRLASAAIGSAITESNKYVEDLNLFNVAMGEYADEAKRYAETVSEAMGIDPAQWLRSQGTFNVMLRSFGNAADKAAFMSKNLTQLGYDIGSLYNIPFEDAMSKIKSGIAGQTRPLRELGIDLSNARLQQDAFTLGINKTVSAMTQAEKSQLRYYALMQQSKLAQGDMARTLQAPANQLRILRAQLTQCARAIGNIFIPILNAVLPVIIAFAKALRMALDMLGSFFGFKLPEIDYSGVSAGAGAMEDLSDNAGSAGSNIGKAADKAKKLKDYLLGIDELNVLRPDNDDDLDDETAGGGGGAGGGAGGGGDLGIDLPGYDFLEGLLDDNTNSMAAKIKAWFEGIGELVMGTGLPEAIERLGKAFNDLGGNKTFWSAIDIVLKSGIAGILEAIAVATNTLADAITVISSVFKMFSDDPEERFEGAYNGINAIKNLWVDYQSLGLIVAKIVSTFTGNDLYDRMKAEIDKWRNWDLAGAIFQMATDFGVATQKFSDALVDFFLVLSGEHREFESIKPMYDDRGFRLNPNSFDGFLDGLYSMLTGFQDWYEQLIKGLAEAEEAWNKFCEDLIKGWVDFATDLEDKWNDFCNGIVEFVNSIIEAFCDALGIHSPSTRFRDDVGQDCGEGWLEGILQPFKDIGNWVNQNILTPINNFLMGNPIETPVDLKQNDWVTVGAWVLKFLGDPVGSSVELIHPLWSTVGEWVKGYIGEPVSSLIDLIKGKSWDSLGTVGNWVYQFIGEPVSSLIDLIKGKTWDTKGTVGEWVKQYIGEPVASLVNLAKNAWTTVSAWVSQFLGGNVNEKVDLIRNAWSTVQGWITSNGFIGGAVSELVNLTKTWTTVTDWVKSWLGSGEVTVTTHLSSSGTEHGGGGGSWETGGVYSNGTWRRVPQFARGGSIHGSMFVAGENGAEVVGHIGGRTEVLNRFQLGSVMHTSIIAGMAQFLPVWTAMNTNIINSANAVISTLSNNAEAINETLLNGNFASNTYNPTPYLSQSMNDETRNFNDNYRDREMLSSAMQEFYTEYVEPTLKDIASDTKRQADKEENINVQVGNRVVTDAVEIQRNANGYNFVAG